MVEQISVIAALNSDAVIIDTRSPAEYEEDCLPGAVNIPILDNQERAMVGTIYKQVSQDKAIEKGLEYFSAKLPQFMKEINKYKNKKLIINCWRGGMRSRAITSFLAGLGYDVKQLTGGYKKFREHVRDTLYNLEIKPKLVVLSGLTCSGKTKLLQDLPTALDLEGLAQHRSSLYGAVGLQPNSQKKFENLLLIQLQQLQNEKYIFIEGESRRIGDVIIPPNLWKSMKRGIQVKVNCPMQIRVKNGVEEYFDTPEKIAKTIEITKQLFKIISKKNKDLIISLFENGKYAEGVQVLLEKYYDPLYSHTLDQIKFDFEVDGVKQLLQKLNNSN